MSINEDMLDDLANSGTSLEDLKNAAPPPASEVGGERVEVVLPNANGAPSYQTPLTDEIKAKLLDPSTKLVELRDNMEEVESMASIQKEVADASTISTSDVEIITESFKDFNKKFRVNSFTEIPSSINLAGTKEYLKEVVRTRMESVATQYNFFVDGVMSDAEASLKTYKEFYGEEVAHSLGEFFASYNQWVKDPNHLNFQNVIFDGEDVNIATAPLDTLLDGSKLHEGFDRNFFHEFFLGAKGFQDLATKDLLVASFIVSVNESYSVDDLINAEHRVNTFGKKFSAMDVIQALASPRALGVIEELHSKAEKAISDLYALEKECGVSRTSFSEMSKFVLSNSAAFDNASDYAHYYSEVIDLVRRLIPVTSTLLGFFVKNNA